MSLPGKGNNELVRFTPPEMVERHIAEWAGLRADIVTAKQRIPFDDRFLADQHWPIVAEYSERDEGETFVEGLPKSTRHVLTGRLTFVPAGHELYNWQEPRVNYYYIDKRGLMPDDVSRFAEIDVHPRPFFFGSGLWRIAAELKNAAKASASAHDGEALGVLLGRELARINGTKPLPQRAARGGLSGRQRKRVADFIEEHLAEELRLSALAGLVDLSPYHFARAFRQSFGLPPHRYHNGRRIARAKALLAEPAKSVTEIARAVGFAETSSFSAAFRKIAGTSPSNYRRGLG